MERIAARPRARIVVLGASDRGKSTFCALLAEHLLQQGRKVAVVDADIGQKGFGLPATVTLGYPSAGRPISETEPVEHYFVGATNPAGHFLPLVAGTAHLVARAEAAAVIVNTTGFVHGPGERLKLHKVEAVAPDAVVAIQAADELESLLRGLPGAVVLRLAPSARARRRSSAERAQARRSSLARYFAEAPTLDLALDELSLRQDRLPRAPRAGAPVRYLLCGVVDDGGVGRGLALLEQLDMEQRRARLVTPVDRERVRILQFGSMSVAPGGEPIQG